MISNAQTGWSERWLSGCRGHQSLTSTRRVLDWKLCLVHDKQWIRCTTFCEWSCVKGRESEINEWPEIKSLMKYKILFADSIVSYINIIHRHMKINVNKKGGDACWFFIDIQGGQIVNSLICAEINGIDERVWVTSSDCCSMSEIFNCWLN